MMCFAVVVAVVVAIDAPRLPHPIVLNQDLGARSSSNCPRLPSMCVHSACVKPRLESPGPPDTHELHPMSPPFHYPRGVLNIQPESYNANAPNHSCMADHAKLLSTSAWQSAWQTMRNLTLSCTGHSLVTPRRPDSSVTPRRPDSRRRSNQGT